MNNKPVAWGMKDKDGNIYDVICPDCGCHFTGEYPFNYTVKELTDEEIYRLLADSIWAVGLNTDCLDEQNWADGITVARAILRKASEK